MKKTKHYVENLEQEQQEQLLIKVLTIILKENLKEHCEEGQHYADLDFIEKQVAEFYKMYKVGK
ncbi:MAG: hypothetical protein AABY22_10095 [Nanoarchaeota archaeon]